MKSKDEVHELLLSLGKSPKTIAKNLLSLNIKGIRADAASCPIARYLRRKRVGSNISVFASSIIRITVSTKTFYFENLIALTDFIRAFDAGRFPKLISTRKE